MKFPKGNQRGTPVSTVRFAIPRAAASKLRSLAASKDRRLLDLGVLAVQINEGDSIVLGINLGKRGTKKTEVDCEKLRGNAGSGRVLKKPSVCRNVGTVHHMPVLSADNPPATLSEIGDEEKKSTRPTNGEAAGNQLYDDFISDGSTTNKPSDGCRIVSSSHTTSYVQELSSLNGRPSSINNGYRLQQRQGNDGSGRMQPPVRSPGSSLQNYSSKREISLNSMPRNCTISPTAEPSAINNKAMGIPSPRNQRARSTSTGSDTSSSSSEENLDSRQLVYNCFVDRSKYCAADMLKQLADNHTYQGSVSGTAEIKRSAAPSKTSSVAATARSNFLSRPFQPPTPATESLSNESSSTIKGSYRVHLKSIRNTSVAALTSNTSTVAAASTVPKLTSEQAIEVGLESQRRSTTTKPLVVATESGVQSKVVWQSTGLSRSASTTNTIGTTVGPPKPTTNPRAREVLWSSGHGFSSCESKSPNITTKETVETSPLLYTSNSSNITNSNIAQIQPTAIQQSSNHSSATMHKAVIQPQSLSDGQHTISVMGNRLSEQVALNGGKLTHYDSQLNMSTISTPPVVHEMKLNTNTGSLPSLQATPSNPPGVTGMVNTVQGGSTSMSSSQPLVRSRVALEATDAVTGTTSCNTQTTWSNQQVSPTYFVGTQTQFGIYPALYQTNVNSSQPGQQANTATYPVNYVYPVSFVYPYLTVAQPNSVANVNSEGSKELEVKSEGKLTDTSRQATETAQGEASNSAQTVTPSQETPQQTNKPSFAVPTQTQFIDLASSMRYWQQLSLLYRSRWQAISACNLPNTAQNANTTDATDVVASGTESKGNTIVENKATNEINGQSNSDEPFSAKWAISQANSRGLSSVGGQGLPVDFSRDVNNNSLEPSEAVSGLQPKLKTEVSASNGRGTEDMAAERPSVIVSNSYKDSHAGFMLPTETSTSHVTQCKLENISDPKHGESKQGSSFVGSMYYEKKHSGIETCSPRSVVNHISGLGDTADELERKPVVGVKRSVSCSPPQLSFIHDSAIACVNVGSNNGNGVGNHGGAKKTGLVGASDAVVRPAKRKKSKRSS